MKFWEGKMTLWEVVFDYNGEKEVYNFWENSQSSVQSFIENMTKSGNLTFVSKKVIKEI